MKKILIVAPHADDEVLGCGGIIAKYCSNGDSVYVAIMTNAHIGDPQLFSEESINIVREEAKKAHKILGVKETFFYDFPAPRLDATPAYLISNELNKLFHKLEIATLYLPHRGDIHKDHTVIFQAALVAARPINNCSIKTILTYETLSETEWAAPFGSDVFIPNVFEEINGFLAKKIEAISCYKSQIKEFPHSRSIESIENLAKYRGVTIGTEYAESFCLIRSIR
jgi:LmbE family N-acetylglucosaminyl deacetylase